MTKGLVIGGSGGIGQLLCKNFLFDATNYRVPVDLDRIIDLSYNYNIIINCIPDVNQNILLEELYQNHTEKKLQTYLITLGSMSYRINDKNHPKNKLLQISENLLLKKSTVRHTLLNLTWCFNNSENEIMSLITENDIVDIFNFLIKSYDKESVISMIEVKGKNVL